MFFKRIEEVGNPIVYIFLTLAISSIFYGINVDFKELSIFIVSFFFLGIFYYCGIRFSSIMIIFFTAGLLINISYYKNPSLIDGEIRIENVTSYNIIASYKGKKIILKSNTKNFNVGEKYSIIGNIENIQDKSKGIIGEVTTKKIIKINGDFISKLYESKKKIYNLLQENLGSRKAGLISSIAFGYSDYLDEGDKEDMKNFGIIHSISVSGLHVAIVYRFLKRILGDKGGLLATIIYVIFTGCNYSSIRAFIMLASVEGGHILRRNNNSLSALCLSAIILLMIKPYSIFEISFDLSYLATLGIILFNKKINYSFYKLPTKLREPLSITLSAQVFTVPYLILIFRDFSMNFIIGNLLLVPFVNIIVVSGNLLPLTYMCQPIFDFISYINLNIIKLFDWSLDKLNNFTLPMFYGNEYVVYFYLFLMLSFYFVKKGYKKFIYLPGIFILVLIVQLYSPILNIKYYKEGAVLVTYRGDRILVSNKSGVDLKRLAKATISTNYYKQGKSIKVKGICDIKSIDKNYVLDTHREKYLLKMTSGETMAKEYDIINFKDGKFNRILIFRGKVFLTYI